MSSQVDSKLSQVDFGAVVDNFYGPLLMVRPPVPATVNKAGANYKSETAHLEYFPRQAFDEWLSICEGIVDFGGDAIFDFEKEDDVFLDAGDLLIAPDGSIHASKSKQRLGHLDNVFTGRVFSANGPWAIVDEHTRTLRALMPHMLTHRLNEIPYYTRLLTQIADETGLTLENEQNPHRWEGLADVAVLHDRIIFTYTVKGHYFATSESTPNIQKTLRSTFEGVKHAANFAGVPNDARIFAELVYPHFHGDTVHFVARTKNSDVLVHYADGLWPEHRARVGNALEADRIVPVSKIDAVNHYAANSRQIEQGVLVPKGVSDDFMTKMDNLNLKTREVPLFELFGKAGGGPACATLYLPRNLDIPKTSSLRFSQRRDEAYARRERLPESITVDPHFFEGKVRG